MIGSVVLSTIIYIGLQFAFILALNPADMAQGWDKLHFTGITGPLAAISIAVGAAWWGAILYADAIVSPTATGFIFTTATARIAMAAGEMGTAPPVLKRVNASGAPLPALILTFFVGAFFFFPFPSWQKLVGYISSVTVLTYGIGPIVLMHLRRTMPEAERPFRLWAAPVLAPVSFIVSNWIILWTGLDTGNFLFGAITVVFALYVVYFYAVLPAGRRGDFGWQAGWWLIPYFSGLWLMLYFGPTEMGGNGAMSFFWSLAISAAFSLAIMALALNTGLEPEATRDYMRQINTDEALPATP